MATIRRPGGPGAFHDALDQVDDGIGGRPFRNRSSRPARRPSGIGSLSRQACVLPSFAYDPGQVTPKLRVDSGRLHRRRPPSRPPLPLHVHVVGTVDHDLGDFGTFSRNSIASNRRLDPKTSFATLVKRSAAAVTLRPRDRESFLAHSKPSLGARDAIDPSRVDACSGRCGRAPLMRRGLTTRGALWNVDRVANCGRERSR